MTGKIVGKIIISLLPDLCGATAESAEGSKPDLGPAPEFKNQVFKNKDYKHIVLPDDTEIKECCIGSKGGA